MPRLCQIEREGGCGGGLANNFTSSRCDHPGPEIPNKIDKVNKSTQLDARGVKGGEEREKRAQAGEWGARGEGKVNETEGEGAHRVDLIQAALVVGEVHISTSTVDDWATSTSPPSLSLSPLYQVESVHVFR